MSPQPLGFFRDSLLYRRIRTEEDDYHLLQEDLSCLETYHPWSVARHYQIREIHQGTLIDLSWNAKLQRRPITV